MTKLYGSLEAGGTKFVCAVGDENYNVVEKVQFPTTKPIETIDKCLEFFSKLPNQGHGIDDISGIDETEKRYLLSTLVDKGLISSYIDYYSLTDKGRKKILEERKKKKLSK